MMLIKKHTSSGVMPLLFLSILFFWGCKKQGDVPSLPLAPIDEQSTTLKQAIIARGFKEDEIEDKGAYFLVQGDISFLKADSAKYITKNRQVMHQVHSYLVRFYLEYELNNTWRQRYLKYFVDASVLQPGVDNWSNAVDAAVAEWNAVPGSHILLLPTGTSADADIIVKSDIGSLADNTMASANLPTALGNPGLNININLDYNSNITISESQKKFGMVHELGHCFGFRHTNSADGTLIPGTPTNDLASVMNGGTAESDWWQFTSWDLFAIRYLYPMPLKGAIQNILGTYGAPDAGYEPINWNASLFLGSTVTIEIFNVSYTTINGDNVIRSVFRREIASNASNTGHLEQGLDYSLDHGGWRIIKVTSNTDPTQYSFSNRFPIVRD